jgi:hypothetical protein
MGESVRSLYFMIELHNRDILNVQLKMAFYYYITELVFDS